MTPLARLADDRILIARVATEKGGIYFCATLPSEPYSTMERDAIAYYVMLQRALIRGAESLSPTRNLEAGTAVAMTTPLADFESVAPVADPPLVSQRAFESGVYRDGESWVAVNLNLSEDEAEIASGAVVDTLFADLRYQRIDDTIGDTSSLASEVWRLFLYLMAVALIVEAILCLPPKPAAGRSVSASVATIGETRERAA